MATCHGAGEGGSRVVGGEGPMTVAHAEWNMTRDVTVCQSRIALQWLPLAKQPGGMGREGSKSWIQGSQQREEEAA